MFQKVLLVFVPVALLTACPSEPKPEATAPVSQAVKAEDPKPAAGGEEDKKAAVEIFANRCVPCHGPQGAGDGPASASLTPKPANFTTPEWQGKVTDEHIEKVVVYGGAAVGKSPAMPPNPDLDQKPGVVKALREHIRSLRK